MLESMRPMTGIFRADATGASCQKSFNFEFESDYNSRWYKIQQYCSTVIAFTGFTYAQAEPCCFELHLCSEPPSVDSDVARHFKLKRSRAGVHLNNET